MTKMKSCEKLPNSCHCRGVFRRLYLGVNAECKIKNDCQLTIRKFFSGMWDQKEFKPFIGLENAVINSA